MGSGDHQAAGASEAVRASEAVGGSESSRRAAAPPWRWRVLAAVACVVALTVALATAPEPTGGGPSSADAPAPGSLDGSLDGPAPSTPTTAAVDYDHTEPAPVPDEVLDGLTFVDVTEAAGLDAERLGREIGSGEDMSGGAAVGDVDGDGDLDLYVPRIGLPNSLYLNDGTGTFTDVAADAGVLGTDWRTGYSGAVFADVDGDDDLDLLVTSASGAAPVLYVNDGSGTFTDEAADRGVVLATGQVPPRVFSATFADWDRDGDLDLALADWYGGPVATLANGMVPGVSATDAAKLGNDQCLRREVMAEHDHQVSDEFGPAQTRLLRNDGTGRFSDATEQLGIAPEELAAFTLTFADADGDGWPDLFVAGDFCTSRLYRNDRGRGFVDVTREAGVGTDENGMGQAIEDLDGDGDLDWFVSGISYPADLGDCPAAAPTIGCSGNRAYRNDGDGTFTDITDEIGVRDAIWGWGVAAVDLTNAGRRDLIVATGWAQAGLTAQAYADEYHAVHRRSASAPSRLWLSTATGSWVEAAAATGFTDRGNGKALIAFDADGDGLLDLLKVNTETPPVLYRNASRSTDPRHWLRVRLRDLGSANSRAVGATVTVTDSSGTSRTAEVRAGGTFQGGGPTDLHVGLGAAGGPAEVVVRWPDADETETFPIARVDQIVTLERDAGG